MKSRRHFEHEQLIDFAEGEVEAGLSEEIRQHLSPEERKRLRELLEQEDT